MREQIGRLGASPGCDSAETVAGAQTANQTIGCVERLAGRWGSTRTTAAVIVVIQGDGQCDRGGDAQPEYDWVCQEAHDPPFSTAHAMAG